MSDPYLDPPGSGDEFYSERTWRLETYWSYLAPAEAPPVAEAPSLKSGQVTFGSLNNFVKLNDRLLEIWIELLNRIPQSRLLLHSKPGSHWKLTLHRFSRCGIDPNRILFVGDSSMGAYLRQYNNIDIALDTTPYAGGTTTCDALYMGVPVVTLRGKTAVGRMGASLLSHLRLNELIAEDADQYLRIAADLAGNSARMVELRSQLRERMLRSPIMDPVAFTSGLESALLAMWNEHCQKTIAREP